MACLTNIHKPSLIDHFKTCLLHGNEKGTLCSGKPKTKDKICLNRAIASPQSGTMPMCRIHKNQLISAAGCRASLPCGFECGRVCKSGFYGNQLCTEHSGWPMPCYFLSLPIEIRLNIYGLLVPDEPIPARFLESGWFTRQRRQVYTTLLRVNHQVHDEAIQIMYAARAFTVQLVADRLIMCNSADPFQERACSTKTMDYQTQLVHLEIQGLRRVLQARYGHTVINADSSNPWYRLKVDIQPYTSSSLVAGTPVPRWPINSDWCPPLSLHYFNMIQCFRIEVVIPGIDAFQASNIVPRPFQLRLYDYCDNLHRLTRRLLLMQRPLSGLEVFLKFDRTGLKWDQILAVTQFLLRPLQRLRDVRFSIVPTIMIENREVNISQYSPGIDPNFIAGVLPVDNNIHDYLNRWVADVRSSNPSPPAPLVEAYWQLEQLLPNLIDSHPDAKSIIFFDELLHTARVARETNDDLAFKEVMNRVMDLWSECVAVRRLFESNMCQSLDAVHTLMNAAP